VNVTREVGGDVPLYFSNLINFGEPYVDSKWSVQSLAETAATDFELTGIYNLLDIYTVTLINLITIG